MTETIAFDNEKYLKEQTAAILDRVEKSGNRLYLEFGGKLFYDYHAARVLPGYDPNVKVRLLRGTRRQGRYRPLYLCRRHRKEKDKGRTLESPMMRTR